MDGGDSRVSSQRRFRRRTPVTPGNGMLPQIWNSASGVFDIALPTRFTPGKRVLRLKLRAQRPTWLQLTVLLTYS